MDSKTDAARDPIGSVIIRALTAGFERGDGSMDQAMQFSGGWWHPKFGCDSLQATLDFLQDELEVANKGDKSDENFGSAGCYTPGPWTASCYLDRDGEWGVLTDHNEIVVVCSTKHHEVNIRLIAAAPDLLEASKELNDHWEQHGDVGAVHFAKLRAAIVKAMGG